MSESSSELVEKVLIVGGGTAGWITAAKLAKSMNSKEPNSVQVTLVESPDIPIIGVGEGTWPTMRKTLESLGIDEGEFMRECDATFKQATKFVNWKESPKNNQNNHYYHLFGSVFNPEEFNLSPYWDMGLAGKDLSYAQAIGTQSEVCEQGLGPKKITTPAYQGLQNYAYHLNAGKFSEFIKKHAMNKLGVKYLSANINDVTLDDEGFIKSVSTDAEGTINADFFVDCSGFRSLLLGDALGVKFKNINDILLNDTAVTMQVPYEDVNCDILPYTTSTAQECGWTWDIGLNNRRGVGYVYSSAHCSHERADEVLRNYVGQQAEGIVSRKIDMKIGYREKYWHKNCLAVGMSAAFIEPLEASAIFLIEAAGNMLSDQFPRTRDEMAAVEKKFNRSFHFRWQKKY
jgi:flavin-dependent dehydrogenase